MDFTPPQKRTERTQPPAPQPEVEETSRSRAEKAVEQYLRTPAGMRDFHARAKENLMTARERLIDEMQTALDMDDVHRELEAEHEREQGGDK